MGNGQDYYQELLRIFKNLKSSDVRETLQDHWKLYQKKHYSRGDNQDEDLRASEEECVASDKEYWKIDMPDGDEIGDIEEESLDDDSQPPRTKLQLSCWTGNLRRSRGNFYLLGLTSNSWQKSWKCQMEKSSSCIFMYMTSHVKFCWKNPPTAKAMGYNVGIWCFWLVTD